MNPLAPPKCDLSNPADRQRLFEKTCCDIVSMQVNGKSFLVPGINDLVAIYQAAEDAAAQKEAPGS